MAELVDAIPFRVTLLAESLESLDLSSGRFSNDTKTVDFEGCSGADCGASELACCAKAGGSDGTGGVAERWSLRAE